MTVPTASVNVVIGVDVAEIQATFEEEFERQCDWLGRGKPVEFINLRVIGEITVDPPELNKIRFKGAPPDPLGHRSIYFGDTVRDTPNYSPGLLGSGRELAGPLIVEEMSSTIIAPSGWALSVYQYGGLHLDTDA